MNPQKTIYAEDLSFWKTGKSSPDVWIDRAKRFIEGRGGKILGEGFGCDASGRAAFMLGFTADGRRFKIIWPVLPSKGKDEKAARVQAATTLYHYVQGVCLYAAVVGWHASFFSHLLLEDGRTASQLEDKELLAWDALAPKLMLIER